MKEASSESPDIDGSRSGAQPAHGFLPPSSTAFDGGDLLRLNEQPRPDHFDEKTRSDNHDGNVGTAGGGKAARHSRLANHDGSSMLKIQSAGQAPSHASSQAARPGSLIETPPKAEEPSQENTNNPPNKNTLMDEIRRNSRLAVTYSWLNVLLIFVPVGIAVSQIDGIHGGVVFAVNAIAIIPLAGLLAFATESVARKMGDALGALLNVTFGNAVELIILIRDLGNVDTLDEIRIVQASLLGSILANLLLILGLSFFLGGLRYREQIYNSTVTQMSACLLSLSVISLVLPTAFHASFSNTRTADAQSLKISRGTSVILLLVYVVYLLFQLKSHAYMYESTPQHIVDAESTPGPAAGWLDSSSSDDSSSSSDSSDSDSSHGTMKKMKKVLRRRRRSSNSSADTADTKAARAASLTTSNATPQDEVVEPSASRHRIPRLHSYEGSEQTIDEDEEPRQSHKRRRHRRYKHRKNKNRALETEKAQDETQSPNKLPENGKQVGVEGEPRRVDFAVQNESESGPSSGGRRPFPLRGMSVKNLAPAVFTEKPDPGVLPPAPSGPVPRVRYGIRRTNSLPDRLNTQIRPPGAMLPSQVPLMALNAAGAQQADKTDDDQEHLSQIGSVILLLVSTALVAVCAEFLVDSIEEVVSGGSVGEIFIGLIVLPIVGNAAEHVTAVTVALKNKMDLAIGVAVGSSIQIAIFITPLVVILGWIMDRDMTLYFTLFETVCLFVSAFIVNFLVLDGRSNYLEGALLCAVYVIISVVAFYYPDEDEASAWGS
ncbi:manganese resistance [Fusarium albosuccineum]|uniref:Manganese resistance n=1 Tax=Fusarium albosuccineum TaxID=1237068 RepID=A0A8H4LNG0_9HYPO|nr:manganese resistance [Fusarium albosuccineum]